MHLKKSFDIIHASTQDGGVLVRVTIYREPCWLLEASELVYSFVNEVPPEKLTAPGTYCIPLEDTIRIRDTVCAQLDKTDKQLRFYFQGVPLEGVPERMSCPAVCVLHQELELGHPEPADMVGALKADWRDNLRNQYYISGIGRFTMNMDKAKEGEFLSLAESITNLPVPSAYQLRLLEVYAAYEYHLQHIYNLLLPVVEALKPLLLPFVKRAAPLLKQWETFFQDNTPEDFLQSRGATVIDGYEQLEIALGYFFQSYFPSRVLGEKKIVRCMMGLRSIPSEKTVEKRIPTPGELAALRLVANPTRMEMLRTMATRAMGVQELADHLGLNVGSVSRDISNMRNAGLLLADYSQERSSYRTNLNEIEKLSDHVLTYLRGESSS